VKIPIAIYFGWSADRRSFIGNAIRYFSRTAFSPFKLAKWNHMFLMFEFSDKSREIHEALMSEGWQKKDYTRLVDWFRENPDHHRFVVKRLWIHPDTILRIYAESTSWIGTRSYAMRQVIAFGGANTVLGRLLGIDLPAGDDRVYCSEGACELVGEKDPAYDLRTPKFNRWDRISPQAAWETFTEKVGG
jgi:hypothetical protein